MGDAAAFEHRLQATALIARVHLVNQPRHPLYAGRTE
jgi:hypothetical protein